MSATDDASGQGLTREELLRRGVTAGVALALPAIGARGALAESNQAPKIKRGGTLRVGVVGGGATETLDPNQIIAEMDTARSRSLFEGLTDFDGHGKVYGNLAEAYSSNADATQWKFKIRPGVVWHNGKTLDAHDVVNALQYILDPANKSKGLAPLVDVIPSTVRAKDPHTVQFSLSRPNSFMDAILGDIRVKIFYGKTFAPPVGTGPFKFKSWTLGERSLFVRNKNYRNGLPYLDAVEYISINDPQARLSALGSRQIDALSQLDPSLVSLAISDSNLRILQSPGGSYTSFCLQVDKPPFTDPQVRLAFKYMVDRRQILVNALQGHGRIGNDLPCWFDADYASKIPQRQHDPEKAKALLQAAGQAGLTVDLVTSDVAPAMLQSSTLFVEQAKQAGVTVNLRQLPTTQYNPVRRQFPFHMENWGGRPLASNISLAYLTTSVFNTTDFKVSQFDTLINQAFATPSGPKRHSLMIDAQQMMWDTGGDIIWGFLGSLDATSSHVHGIQSSVIKNLGYYNLQHVWLD